MTSKVRIDFEAHGTNLVKREIDGMGDAADRTTKDFDKLGKESGHLTKKISEAEAEIKKLVKTFDETGDMDLLKSIRKEQSNLRIFTKLAGNVASEAAEVGTEAGIALNQSLTKSLMASKGLIIPPLVAAALMAAPVMGAAISSAVIGAAGAGGLIGGIVAAAQDQRVQDAAKQVGNRVGGALTEAGAAFVGPVIESLNVLDNAGDRLADNLEKAGSKIAPVLPALAGGIAGFADAVGPGFIRAMDAAKPVLRALSSELPKIGDSISDMFDKLSDDPDQAVMGIVAISQAIQGVIDVSGDLLSALGDIFEWSSRSGAAMSETWESLFGWMPIAGDHIERVGAGFREQVNAIDAARNSAGDYTGDLGGIIRAEEEVEKTTKTATDAIEDQIKAMDKMMGRLLDPIELASNYQEAIDDLTESIRENGGTLDLNTEKGRANSEALRNLAESIGAIRSNTIETTGDVAAANAVYDQQVDALRRQMVALGMSKQAADAWAASLRSIPSKVDVDVRAPGLLDAIARAEYLRRLLGSNAAAARSNPITINGQFHPGDDSGYGGGRAGGGPMQAGKWYTVGENGVEVVSMHPGGGATVYNNKQTESMMSGASGGASMGGVPSVALNVQVQPTGRPLDDAVVEALAYRLRVTGGVIGEFQIPRIG